MDINDTFIDLIKNEVATRINYYKVAVHESTNSIVIDSLTYFEFCLDGTKLMVNSYGGMMIFNTEDPKVVFENIVNGIVRYIEDECSRLWMPE